MNDVQFITIEGMNGPEEHAIIDRGGGEYTSMSRATYEAMIEQQAQPIRA